MGTPSRFSVGLAVIALPVLYYAVTPEYRAGLSGQPSTITLAREFIEVPDTRGAPIRFATQGLTLRVTHIRVVYVIAVVPGSRISRVVQSSSLKAAG